MRTSSVSAATTPGEQAGVAQTRGPSHTGTPKAALTRPLGTAPSVLWPFAALLLVAVAAVLLARLVFGYRAIGQDQAWLMYAASRVAAGVPLYGAQLTETNPPLIIWLSLLPLAVGHLLHLAPAVAFYLCTAVAVVLSSLWCAVLLRGTDAGATAAGRLVFAVVVLAVEARVPLESAGQREHLCTLLLLPFAVAFGLQRSRALAPAHAAALGAAAAVGVCIKPQQMLTLLALQLACWWLGRRWPARGTSAASRRSLHVAIVCSFAVYPLYVAAVAVAAPLYFHTMVPLLRQSYWAFGHYTAWQAFRMDRHFAPIFVAAAAALWLWRARGGGRSFAAVALVLSASSMLAYALQHTGFSYQHIPADSFADLALLWLLAEAALRWLGARADTHTLPRWLPAAFAACVLLSAGWAAQHAVRMQRHDVADDAALAGFFATLPAGTPVVALSTNPQANFPYILQDHLVLASRFVHLWLLPAAEQNEYFAAAPAVAPHPRKVLSPNETAVLAHTQAGELAADLDQRRPAYVLVPHCDKAFTCEAVAEPGFDTLRWLQRDPVFRASWSAYLPMKTLIGRDGRPQWDVYTRR